MISKSDIHILVVEDEDLIRNIFQQSLETWGYQVKVASNGQEALELCERENFHIVITDLNMPLMDGMTLLKKIKSRWPFVDVFVVTGYATIESAIEALKTGAYDFILKPVNFDQLRISLNRCFQKIQAETENTELRELNARLQELAELKEKFLSLTNHEIRTPLTVIKGYLEILNLTLQEADEEVKEILQILQNATAELSDTVERMHLLSRLDRGELVLQLEPLEINSIARNVYQEMKRLFDYREITLELQLDPEPLWILGSAKAMQLIFRELLQNALKFTPNGGKVRLKTYPIHHQVGICISDTGIGVPYDKQELIFTKFYEVQDVVKHSSSKKDFMGGGLGIGLSLVKELVTDMKGKILLDSTPGLGSSFIIYIPEYKKEKRRTHGLETFAKENS